MGTRKSFILAELEDAINDPNFFEGDDDSATVDTAELLPDKVGIVSDIEDTNENTLANHCSNEVPGRLEVHSSILNIASRSIDPNNNSVTRTELKVEKQIQIGKK
ncbi:hypothetical protein NPIL_109711 [Nephila pilipes]|uniref:Uncharacterized protein n=1 Tax=Nephila pilipes TaxID=299642 RepID=A0A8X6Q5Y6_NEPPI|nr:hypothetical protein NPIL_109711 [Nephila pilipes]